MITGTGKSYVGEILSISVKYKVDEEDDPETYLTV